MNRRLRRYVAIVLTVFGGACASAPPRASAPTGHGYPDFPTPDVPVALGATQDLRARQALGWQLLQSGDLRGATREFNEALKLSPTFYPAETALGFVSLASRQFKPAVTRFAAALARDANYAPALEGLAQAHAGLQNYEEAAAAIERLIAIDPKRDQTQLEMLRFRQVQGLIEQARRARQAKRLDEAGTLLSRALELSPKSAVILRELALTDLAKDQTYDAEAHARAATALDPSDAESHAILGSIWEGRGRFAEAAAAYDRAATVDPSWRPKAEAARAAAKVAGPPELRDLASAATVTRAQLAGLTATRLEALVARAPKRSPQVMVDLQGNWAAAWIVSVTQAGIMDVFTNHTFQPAATVRRGDLAQVAGRLIAIAMADRADELARWQTARPSFADLSAANLFYRPAALAVSAGAMSADESGRFFPTRPATGTEVTTAIGRIEQIARR